MKKLFIIFSICILTLITRPIQAQLFSDEPVNTIIPFAGGINITVTGTNPNATFSTISDYTNGIYNYNAVHLKITSNKPYYITALAATANFSTSTTSVMPCSKLYVSLAGFDAFYPLSNTNPILLVTSSVSGNNVNYDVDYRFFPGFGYKAGAYSLSVVYTGTQN